MNAIIGITSLVRHDAADKGKVIEYADKIDISSQHLLGLINDVLDMSKIEARKTVFKYSDFSILDFIQELEDVYKRQLIWMIITVSGRMLKANKPLQNRIIH